MTLGKEQESRIEQGELSDCDVNLTVSARPMGRGHGSINEHFPEQKCSLQFHVPQEQLCPCTNHHPAQSLAKGWRKAGQLEAVS